MENIPPAISGRESVMERLLGYVSLSGSFSRMELLVATLVLGGMAAGITGLAAYFPEAITANVAALAKGLLYPVWGMALGKRSRDLGMTFTYGTVIGMIFPVMGIVFLFQGGKKARDAAAEKPREDAEPATR